MSGVLRQNNDGTWLVKLYVDGLICVASIEGLSYKRALRVLKQAKRGN